MSLKKRCLIKFFFIGGCGLTNEYRKLFKKRCGYI
jgi:hypothetical protein